jgi:hypothetical protein
LDKFWATAYQNYYLSELDLIRARGLVLSEYIVPKDEDESDEEGSIENSERCWKSYRLSHVGDGGGDAL